MNYYAMTDGAIQKEIGMRFKRLRLEKNITQAELANRTLLSTTAIKSLEKGKANLSTLIAALRELKALENIDVLIPDPGISPIMLAKMKGKKRKRASRKNIKDTTENKGESW